MLVPFSVTGWGTLAHAGAAAWALDPVPPAARHRARVRPVLRRRTNARRREGGRLHAARPGVRRLVVDPGPRRAAAPGAGRRQADRPRRPLDRPASGASGAGGLRRRSRPATRPRAARSGHRDDELLVRGDSTMRPPSSTATRSARSAVERRWAIVIIVRPPRAAASACSTAASVCGSSDEVASSRTITAGSASATRAIETSWRSPDESRTPRDRTSVPRPPGSASKRSSAPIARQRGAHLALVRVRPREPDVVGDRCPRRDGPPAGRRRSAAGARRASVAQVDAAERDRPALRVVEAHEQLRERRLAGAGRADEREVLARLDRQRDVVDRRALAGVGEGHAGRATAAPTGGSGDSPPVTVTGVCEQRRDLRQRGAARLELAVPVAEPRDRVEQRDQVERERDDRADETRPWRSRYPPATSTAASASDCANAIIGKKPMLTSEMRRQAATCARDRAR